MPRSPEEPAPRRTRPPDGESGQMPAVEHEALIQELSRQGLRATRQRVALLRILRGAPGHPTAVELYRTLRREQRSVSKKTVYEVLSSFVREGLASCVTDGGEPFHYEARTGRHYHARCRVCEHLFDIPAAADGQIRGRTDLPEGFRVEVVNVTIRGVCIRCRDEI